MRKEIVFVGEGGQGIVLMGEILGKVAQLCGKEVAIFADYGAAARGGKCASEIVISDRAIDFPGVVSPDILVAMSQRGYDAWISKISPKTKVFFDADTVKSISPALALHIPVLATKKAIEIGFPLSANMVMLGAIVAVTKLVSLRELFEIIKKETGRFAEINLEAVKEGYKLGKEKEYLKQKR